MAVDVAPKEKRKHMSTYQSLTHFIRIITEKTEKGRTRRVLGWAACPMAGGPEGRGASVYDANTGLGDIISEARSAAIGDALDADHSGHVTAIIAGYDLAYDLQGSWGYLASEWRVEPLAKGVGDLYSVRLYERDSTSRSPEVILWDLCHVTPLGVTNMAERLGMERDGSATGDTEIMRAYVRDLMTRHHLSGADGTRLGSSVITMTSIARHDSDLTVGALTYRGRGGRERTVRGDYLADAAREAPRDYDEYARRKACTRGGFAFVGASHACQVLGRVISIDETSAHHAQVMRSWVPEKFEPARPRAIKAAAERVMSTSVEDVLSSYHLPFLSAFHAQFRFTGVRLREGSVWEHEAIGLESTARLMDEARMEGVDDESSVTAEAAVRSRGYRDTVTGETRAFGKVMAARELVTWMTELEAWCFAQVYEWDEMEVLSGDLTMRFKRPDDYATLTSMRMFARKQELKRRRAAASDPRERERLDAIYRGEVKPQFNSVGYGLHARDEYKPAWHIDDAGEWSLDTPLSPENFEDRKVKRPKAWYTYGIRIAGGSRMHLVIAVELLWRRFGDSIGIAGGDTDSIKVITTLPENEVLSALEPLHESTRKAIARTTARAARMWPDDYRPMTGVGEFEVEDTYVSFYTPGVKQYCGIKPGGEFSLTLAGVPGGKDSYMVWLKLMTDKYGPEVWKRVFTFDVQLAPSVSHVTVPPETSVTRQDGFVSFHEPESVYYTLNGTEQLDARESVRWLRTHGVQVTLDPAAECSWALDGAGAKFTSLDGELASYDLMRNYYRGR